MARNSEKAMTLFSKWQSFKADFHSDKGNRRPLLDSEVSSLSDAEKFRREVVSSLTKKVSMIRNAGLGEPRIRELNDEINKLVRKKHFWEKKIRELGGSVTSGKQFYDIDGKELPGAPGYKYYGAAKDLPGIRELFAAQEDQDQSLKRKIATKRSRAELYKHVTPDYYGFRDDDGESATSHSDSKQNAIGDEDEGDQPVAKQQQLSLVEAELQQERELMRSIPRYLPSSAESDEEYENLTALPLIAQQQLGIPPTNTEASSSAAAQDILQRIEDQQRAKLIEFSRKQLMEKFAL
jgi:pre-mRNA-splicing factor ISY1